MTGFCNGDLRQLGAVAVARIAYTLKAIPVGIGQRLEVDAFAKTRTILDGRRVLNMLRFQTHSAREPGVTWVMTSVIADLESILPKSD